MSLTLIAWMFVLNPQVALTSENPVTAEWSLDCKQVYVGGPVCIILSGHSRHNASFRLRVDDSPSMQILSDVGQAVESHEEVMVLHSHLMVAPEVTQDSAKASIKVRIPPVFALPGKAQLTIEFDGVTLDMKTVEVLPAPDSADRAMDLIYPEIERGASSPSDVLWTQLISNSMFGVTPRITSVQLQQLRDELPVIMEHPGWAEIAEMLVARLEARVHYQQLVESEQGRPLAIKEEIGELPLWPVIVTKCLSAKPQSPYSQEIQQDISSVVKDLRILNAQRRGEDIMPIIKEPFTSKH